MMRNGAQDYVLKDRIARLASAVRRETKAAQARQEHRRVEDRLRDRDECLAFAVSVTQLGTFDFHPQSGRFALSAAGHRHIGLPPDVEVSYETAAHAVHPDDREHVDGLIGIAFDPESGGEYIADYRAVGIDDQVERWLTARGRVLFDPQGIPMRFVGITIETTARKQLEEQFRQAQKLESIGVLAGGIAHDFNNLLTVITGYTQMTLDDLPASHPSRAGIEQVFAAAARAADLTRQLLMFSRHQPSQTETLLLNQAVENIKNMLGRLIGEDVNLTARLDPATGTIRADAGHVDQVIMNLVINARDAMPNGGKVIIETGRCIVEKSFAELHPGLSPGRYATLTVTDTGTGMSPEVKAHIFDPFFTTKQPGKGTGLGLSTVYGIVRECGGSISVSSELGRGTRFTVFLPAFDGEPGKAAATTRPAVPMPTGSETILVAEDDAGIRRFVRTILERQGYRVLECSNGIQAIQRAQQHPGAIHLLLTDVVMPEGGGFELATQFAACRPGVPVLFVSGYIDSMKSLEAAEGDYLGKPFTPAVLLTRVRALLDRRK